MNTSTATTAAWGTEMRRGFTPPTVEEVGAHISEKGFHFDPEAFVAFYESKGWRVGKAPMVSWRAACVTWEKRPAEVKAPHIQVPACDDCTQGVMDMTNPHRLGTCTCTCHSAEVK